MRILGIILLLLTFIGIADGSWYQSGSYWYYGSGLQAYTRRWVPAYYSGGCCVQEGYYSYVRYTPPATQNQSVTINLPSASDPNWEAKMIDAAVRIDRQGSFNRSFEILRPAVEALQQQSQPSYGGARYSHGSTYIGPAGAYGATIYANTAGQLLLPYDPNIGVQYLGQSVQQTVGAADKAVAGLKDFVTYEAQVRQTLGAYDRINQGIIGAQKAAITTQQSGPAPQQNRQFLQVRVQRCGSCHTNADFSDWDNRSAAEYANTVLQRLTTQDPDRRMPRINDGTPRGRAGSLPDGELRILANR